MGMPCWLCLLPALLLSEYEDGRTSHQRLSSVERFDPAANTWSFVAPMCNVRSAAAAAVMGNQLYAIGGNSEIGGSLASVERCAWVLG